MSTDSLEGLAAGSQDQPLRRYDTVPAVDHTREATPSSLGTSASSVAAPMSASVCTPLHHEVARAVPAITGSGIQCTEQPGAGGSGDRTPPDLPQLRRYHFTPSPTRSLSDITESSVVLLDEHAVPSSVFGDDTAGDSGSDGDGHDPTAEEAPVVKGPAVGSGWAMLQWVGTLPARPLLHPMDGFAERIRKLMLVLNAQAAPLPVAIGVYILISVATGSMEATPARWAGGVLLVLVGVFFFFSFAYVVCRQQGDADEEEGPGTTHRSPQWRQELAKAREEREAAVAASLGSEGLRPRRRLSWNFMFFFSAVSNVAQALLQLSVEPLPTMLLAMIVTIAGILALSSRRSMLSTTAQCALMALGSMLVLVALYTEAMLLHASGTTAEDEEDAQRWAVIVPGALIGTRAERLVLRGGVALVALPLSGLVLGIFVAEATDHIRSLHRSVQATADVAAALLRYDTDAAEAAIKDQLRAPTDGSARPKDLLLADSLSRLTAALVKYRPHIPSWLVMLHAEGADLSMPPPLPVEDVSFEHPLESLSSLSARATLTGRSLTHSGPLHFMGRSDPTQSGESHGSHLPPLPTSFGASVGSGVRRRSSSAASMVHPAHRPFPSHYPLHPVRFPGVTFGITAEVRVHLHAPQDQRAAVPSRSAQPGMTSPTDPLALFAKNSASTLARHHDQPTSPKQREQGTEPSLHPSEQTAPGGQAGLTMPDVIDVVAHHVDSIGGALHGTAGDTLIITFGAVIPLAEPEAAAAELMARLVHQFRSAGPLLRSHSAQTQQGGPFLSAGASTALSFDPTPHGSHIPSVTGGETSTVLTGGDVVVSASACSGPSLYTFSGGSEAAPMVINDEWRARADALFALARLRGGFLTDQYVGACLQTDPSAEQASQQGADPRGSSSTLKDREEHVCAVGLGQLVPAVPSDPDDNAEWHLTKPAGNAAGARGHETSTGLESGTLLSMPQSGDSDDGARSVVGRVRVAAVVEEDHATLLATSATGMDHQGLSSDEADGSSATTKRSVRAAAVRRAVAAAVDDDWDSCSVGPHSAVDLPAGPLSPIQAEPRSPVPQALPLVSPLPPTQTVPTTTDADVFELVLQLGSAASRRHSQRL